MARKTTLNSILGGEILERGPEIRRWILFVGVVGVPVVFLRSTNDPFNAPKLALLIVVVAAASALRLIEILQGAGSEGLRRLALPAAALVLPLSLAWLLGPYKYWSLWGEYLRYQGLLPYLLVVLFGVLVADAFGGRVERLAWAVTISAGVVGGYALAQYFGLDLFDWTNRFGGEAELTSTLGNSNFAGGFLGITLPVAAALALAGGELRTRVLLCAALALGGLVVTFSQGGWAAAVAGSVVLGGIVMSRRWSPARIVGVVVAGLIALAAASLVVIEMVKPGTGPIPETAKLRALWWEGAVDMAADSPIWGHGPNAFAVEGYDYRPPEDALNHWFDFSDDPHSIYLGWLTAAGVLGLGGLLTVFGWCIARGRRIEPDAVLGAGFAAGVAGYAVQGVASIDELSLRVALWTCVAGLAASMASGSTGRSSASKKKRTRTAHVAIRNVPAVILCAVLSVVAMYGGVRFLVADGNARSALIAFAGGNVQDGSERFSSAISLRGDYEYRHLLGFYLGEAAYDAGEGGSDLMERSAAAFAFLQDFPDVPALRDEGRAMANFAEFDEKWLEPAADAYADAMSIDRFNAQLIPEGAEVLLRAEHYEELVALLEPDLELLASKTPSLWAAYALAQLESGDEEAAAVAAQRALDIAPGDERALEVVRRIDQGNK